MPRPHPSLRPFSLWIILVTTFLSVKIIQRQTINLFVMSEWEKVQIHIFS